MGRIVMIDGKPMIEFTREELEKRGLGEALKNYGAILVVPRGCGNTRKMIREYIARCEMAKELPLRVNNDRIATIDTMDALRFTVLSASGEIDKAIKELQKACEPPNDTKSIDKRIKELKKAKKHARNPMELRKIDQELSAAYREKKHPDQNSYRREVEGKW